MNAEPRSASFTTAGARPPFRADHVGSLLRPEELKQARERLLGAHGVDTNFAPHNSQELRAVEDECVRAVIAMQERVGLQSISDGELRRRSFMLELFLSWDGMKASKSGVGSFKWKGKLNATEDLSAIAIVEPIRWKKSAVLAAFEFLKANTRQTPKVCIPAPNLAHYFLANSGKLDGTPYDDMEQFWADLIKAYRQELRSLVEAGATYIQFDDVCFAYLCDPAHRAYVTARGYDPDALLDTYADKINAVIAGLPPEVTVTVHTCRGNREGSWVAEGAYEPVADILFNRTNVSGYFLEYDTDRAGGFGPLRYLPKGKIVVLGLLSSKTPVLESVDTLRSRIDEASKVVGIEQLALSPQCGFASSYRGNPLTFAEQEAKLGRVVEVAEQVWR
ncbi:MAG: 5-methyltetrahydropteroyltriglutamate--homocysteine S-methyltransferase [Pseudorhodoplanes sp.]|uniref:5-methyltetrahydropteroyltriglutamate-- homocysteine S-methyltransferase n=1 Tax=Pseudorhodoplanes sp. TaxID=1934341 RepID=UPI003D0D8F82